MDRASAGGCGGRDPVLDAVKGFLVFAMVVYHAMNYFSTAPAGSYGALRFLNGAFVFLAGFACTMGLGAGAGEPARRGQSARRLCERGLRLLALFSALNLSIAAAGVASYRQADASVAGFVDDLAGVYLTGDSPRAAFRILVPIAYTLALASAFAVPGRARAALAVVVAAAAASYAAVLPFAPLPHFVLVGLCGAVLGALAGPAALAGPLADRPAAAAASLLLGLAAAAAMDFLSANALAYAAGVALVLRLLHGLLGRLDPGQPARRCAELLGRYALLGYVAQIVLFFAIHRALGAPRWPLGVEIGLVCTAVTLLLVLLCLAVARLRTNLRWVDRGYRAVFG